MSEILFEVEGSLRSDKELLAVIEKANRHIRAMLGAYRHHVLVRWQPAADGQVKLVFEELLNHPQSAPSVYVGRSFSREDLRSDELVEREISDLWQDHLQVFMHLRLRKLRREVELAPAGV